MLKLMMIMIGTLLLSFSYINLKKLWHSLSAILFLSTFFSFLFLYNPLLNQLSNSVFMLDSINTPLINLSLWITSLMILASYYILTSKSNSKSFIQIIISMEIILLMAFSVNNMIMFYITFETSLIPITLLILGWGYQPERLQAGFYMMLYTILASFPLLLMIIITHTYSGNSSFLNSWKIPYLSSSLQSLLWLMYISAFLVKMPMFFAHLWLPKAHVEAPVAGSMILAGILLKLGSYGLLRVIVLLPSCNMKFNSMISSISITGAMITSIICLRQTDLKSLIAYSSVGHMGLLTAGIMSNSLMGWSGAIMMMIAHGLSSSAMFAISYMTYETTKTRSTYLTKGMYLMFPHMTLMWFILCAINMAAPPSFNLLSEIFLITSILHLSPWTWLMLSLTSFLSAAYSLFLYSTSQHGMLPQFMNSLHTYSMKNYSIIYLHIFPVFLFMLKPSIMMF